MRRRKTTLSRRGLVAGLVSAALSGIARPGISGDRVKRFRALPTRLAGFPEDALDRVLARDLMHGLQAAGALIGTLSR